MGGQSDDDFARESLLKVIEAARLAINGELLKARDLLDEADAIAQRIDRPRGSKTKADEKSAQ